MGTRPTPQQPQPHSQFLPQSLRKPHQRTNLPLVRNHVSPSSVSPATSASRPYQSCFFDTNLFVLFQRPRNVPQTTRHRHRPRLRQMRRQMPRLRLLRPPHHPRPHLRRVLLRQLPEQVRRVRRRGHLRRVLLLRMYAVGEG